MSEEEAQRRLAEKNGTPSGTENSASGSAPDAGPDAEDAPVPQPCAFPADLAEKDPAAAAAAGLSKGTPGTESGPSGGSGDASGNTSGDAPDSLATNPESATGYRTGMAPVTTATYAVSTANPLATQAACDILRDGGTAADAVVTAQMVLGLVEPQSSGIGGGGYLLYWDAKSSSLSFIDGRETAPLAASGSYLTQVSPTDDAPVMPDARRSGRSIGVPGIVSALGKLHDEQGATDWAALFDPAITLARQGFTVSPRLAATIQDNAEDLAKDPGARALFLSDDGSPRAAGTHLRNPDYATTLEALARGGSDALYTGALAKHIVDKATGVTPGPEDVTPSLLTTADLAAYTPVSGSALCGPYRDVLVCGPAGSSSGGLTVLSSLGIIDQLRTRTADPVDITELSPAKTSGDGSNSDASGGTAVPTVDAVHVLSEAERLAYADRDAYSADPAFEPLPGSTADSAGALLSTDYLAGRAREIDLSRSMGEAEPGELTVTAGRGPQLDEHGTSHISVIDKEGNAASMTTSVESAFGSFHVVDGFVLNNQLTDFSAEPRDEEGRPVANRVEGGKRPRSSMSPMMVFRPTAQNTPHELVGVVGSPGGALIPQFVVKTLVAMLDWGMDPQTAIEMPLFGARNEPTTRIGGEHPTLAQGAPALRDLVAALEDRGHEVTTDEQSSGLSALVREDGGHIVGGADPRREGVVLGDHTAR